MAKYKLEGHQHGADVAVDGHGVGDEVTINVEDAERLQRDGWLLTRVDEPKSTTTETKGGDKD
jgi:hypothetical protein